MKTHRMYRAALAAVAALTLALVAGVPHLLAAEDTVLNLSIKDHKFDPATIEAPAGKRFKLVVKNLDPTAEEFESHDFKREKVIPGGGTITLQVGPLKAGTYKFFGEFYPLTAQGQLIVK